MTHSWRTAWQGQDILVFRDDAPVDRLTAAAIERIVFVYRGAGESVGDLLHAVVETADDVFILPAETGFGGRVNFERLDYWAERQCIYWVPQAQGKLPLRLRRSRWWPGLGHASFVRVARSEWPALMAQWPLEGPQTWDQRKWRRIERLRPFGASGDGQRVRA